MINALQWLVFKNMTNNDFSDFIVLNATVMDTLKG